MNYRQFYNFVVVAMLAAMMLGISLGSWVGLAQAAPAPVIAGAKSALAIPPALPPTGTSLSPGNIDEGLAGGATVGAFTSTDDDLPAQTFTYTFTDTGTYPDNNAFTITDATLTANNSLDFETKSSYSIRVLTTDSGGESIETVFTITVNNVNETPTDIALNDNSIAENAGANATVGTFSASDPDAGSTFTYALVTGTGDTGNSAFNISDSTLRATSSLNFEAQSSYSIRVQVTDNGGLSFVEVFTINVTNANEAPTALTLDNNSIAENAGANATVGTFSASDEDAGSSFTYQLVSGTGSSGNSAFNISGSTLRATSDLNFEAQSSYSIRVRVTDNTGLSFDQVFTINVTNVNEQPTDITLNDNLIAENAGANATVGTFSASDPDAGSSFTYQLVSGTGSTDNSAFNISGNTLRATNNLDFATQSSFSIRVQVTDNGGLTFVEVFTINVTDVLPTISVTKTANPTSVPETGANVTFTIRVNNTSQENTTINLFSDNRFDLGVRCPTSIGTTITPGNNYTCSFTAFVSGDYPGNHQNTATAVVGDNESHASVASNSATVSFTDVQPNFSVAYTSNPFSVNEPGGNVAFSVLITNLSAEAGTLTLLQDSTFGSLNGQGTCATGGTLTANGGTYSCSFTKLVSGTFGQTRVYTATARLTDDESNNKNVTDNASVFIGEMRKVYLPIIAKPIPTDLSVFNDNTGGNITFTVIGTGVSCTVPNNTTQFCGSFLPGIYTVEVISACGNANTTKTYESGPQTTRVYCN